MQSLPSPLSRLRRHPAAGFTVWLSDPEKRFRKRQSIAINLLNPATSMACWKTMTALQVEWRLELAMWLLKSWAFEIQWWDVHKCANFGLVVAVTWHGKIVVVAPPLKKIWKDLSRCRGAPGYCIPRRSHYEIETRKEIVWETGKPGNPIRNHPQDHHYNGLYKPSPVMVGVWQCFPQAPY